MNICQFDSDNLKIVMETFGLQLSSSVLKPVIATNFIVLTEK